MTETPTNKKTLAELYALWDKLGDVPTGFDGDYVDCLEEPFLHFPVQTHRETVWHWFEAQHPDFIAGEVMQGVRRGDTTENQVGHG
jgi:hypothetical protein